MAKRRKQRTRKPKPKKVAYRTTIYQIQIKGPERNAAFRQILGKIKNQLLAGRPLTKANSYGCVIRSISGQSYDNPEAIELLLVKYNQKKTGLAWNVKKSELIENTDNVTAQRTKLVIFIEHHFAILIQKPHGPSPSEMTEYLTTVFRETAQKTGLEISIDVLPLKVGGASSQIKDWKTLNHFSIEFLRPNPSPSHRSRTLRNLLNETDADKGKLDFDAKKATGLKRTGLIGELIREGDRLIKKGQGKLFAKGKSHDDEKEEIDSEKTKVKKFPVITNEDDKRELPQLLFDTLKRFIL